MDLFMEMTGTFLPSGKITFFFFFGGVNKTGFCLTPNQESQVSFQPPPLGVPSLWGQRGQRGRITQVKLTQSWRRSFSHFHPVRI